MTRDAPRRFVLPEIVFGSGALDLAGRYARGFDARKVLLVTDPGVQAAGWARKVTASLQEAGMAVIPFAGVSPNPRDREVSAGLELCLREDCDLIVAVGGGSPMDCAKGISICAENGGSILDYEGVDRVPLPGLPLVCVPTTAGTSADISQFAIVNDMARRVKIAIISKKVVPDAALIDPRTTSTMPPELTAATGMDALCHACEAYVSLGASALTDLPALKAVQLVGANLVASVRAARRGDGTDPRADEARSQMMLASYFAGQAFSNASLGLVHAMAHALGGLLDAPHGLCNAILLDQVALANADAGIATDEAYGRLAQVLHAGRMQAAERGGGQAAGPGTEAGNARPGHGAVAFAEEVRNLKAELGLSRRLSDLGVRESDIPSLAVFASRDPCMATNPRAMGADAIAEVYGRAF